jgi:hypothetical protein
MTTKTRIQVLVTIPTPVPEEVVVSVMTLDYYAPDLLDKVLESVLKEAHRVLDRRGIRIVDGAGIEVSLQLSSTGDSVRPSLHLSSSTISSLSAVGASLDFDPYCDG